MAILIKGMEIPDSCFLCRFCRRQEYGEYVGEDTAWSCVASKKRITDGHDLKTTFKHPDCPLVEAAEVPDAVSRQAAIEAINTWDKFGVDERGRLVRWHEGLELYVHLRDVLTAIVNLPSAQPEIEERMSETEQNVPNDDFISRKRAIDAIEAVFPVDPMKSEYAQGIACGAALSKTYIEQLPSAQPECNRGKWIHCDIEPDDSGRYPLGWMPWYCSECGVGVGKHQTAFCPNCGADMRGEQE